VAPKTPPLGALLLGVLALKIPPPAGALNTFDVGAAVAGAAVLGPGVAKSEPAAVAEVGAGVLEGVSTAETAVVLGNKEPGVLGKREFSGSFALSPGGAAAVSFTASLFAVPPKLNEPAAPAPPVKISEGAAAAVGLAWGALSKRLPFIAEPAVSLSGTDVLSFVKVLLMAIVPCAAPVKSDVAAFWLPAAGVAARSVRDIFGTDGLSKEEGPALGPSTAGAKVCGACLWPWGEVRSSFWKSFPRGGVDGFGLAL